MQNVAWILFCSVLGIGCGCGALAWVCRMFRTRGREERLSRTEQILLLVGAAVCGGVIGSFTNGWLPMVATMAVLTVGMAAAVSDWVCRIIPNPTVLAVFALKLLLMVGAMLKLAGAPSFSVLSALGGMVFCFLLFSAPGLLKRKVGAGDIKFAAAIGFLLGFEGALLAVAAMGMLILAYSMLQRKVPLIAFLKTDIPMGPFIAAGMMISWMAPYAVL